MDANTKAMMDQIDNWAADQINTGENPPWAFYHLMQLRDAIQRVKDDAQGKMTIPVTPVLKNAGNE